MIRSKRGLKKYLRTKERQLNGALLNFIDGFDPAFDANLSSSAPLPEQERNHRVLLRLRWLSYEFLRVRLKLHPMWRNTRWFLELFDVEEISIHKNQVRLVGEIIWWAEGKDAVGQWWPLDHAPHLMGFHRLKLRGDLGGGDGKWVIEPMKVILSVAKTSNRNAKYDLEFGYGTTYLKITNDR